MSKPLPAASLVTWWDVHTAPPKVATPELARAPRPRTRLSVA